MLDESKSSGHSLLSVSCLPATSSQSIVPLYQLKKSFAEGTIEAGLIETRMLRPHFPVASRRECKSTSDETYTFEVNNNEPVSRPTKMDLICHELLTSSSLRSRLNKGKFGYNPLKKSHHIPAKKSSTLNNLNLFNSSKLKRLQTKAIQEKKLSDYNHNKKLFQAVISNDLQT
ncbi:hypothetical protein BpHYR1_040112, partial [Brachionus plicatilis]